MLSSVSLPQFVESGPLGIDKLTQPMALPGGFHLSDAESRRSDGPEARRRRNFHIRNSQGKLSFSETKRDSGEGISRQAPGFSPTVASLVIESSLPMPKPTSSADSNRIYRQRLRAAGVVEVLFQLPVATVAMLDEIKERQGLRNRSQALLELTEQKGARAQHTT